jgi:hypothetical protein
MVKLTWQCGIDLWAVFNLRDKTRFGGEIKIVQPRGNKDMCVAITSGLIIKIKYYLMEQNIEAGYIFPQGRSRLLQEGAHN